MRLLLQEGAELAAIPLAPATWEQYSLHFFSWLRFLLVFGLLAHLPCPPEGVLCAYAAFMARTCAAPMVRQYLKGLKYNYGAMGIELPWSSFRRLECLLMGLRRLRGEGTHRKLPITPPLLLEFTARMPPGSAWHALFTCCMIGVFGMLRRSNLVPGAVSLFGQAKHITRADIEFVRARYALRVRVRFSKTRSACWRSGSRATPAPPPC